MSWMSCSIGLICALIMAFPAYSQPSQWKPEKNVEIVVTTGPGGALDRVARAIQKIWQDKKALDSVSVVNKQGGGGALAWAYINQHVGDGHYLTITSGSVLDNHITRKSTLNYTDFTPLAILADEYTVFAVRADSPLKDGRDVIERIKKDPVSVAVGVASTFGATPHIALCLAVKAAGGDVRKLRVVVFNSGSESLTALMGGHIDLVPTGASNALPYARAGKIRLLAVSAPQRLGSVLAEVPTWREQGVNSIYAGWRGAFGPKGLRQDQIAYWDQQFSKLVATEAWQRELETNVWAADYRNSTETATFLKGEYDQLKAILVEIGLANGTDQGIK
jgi:putative tricarboxylic transport membrane protein